MIKRSNKQRGHPGGHRVVKSKTASTSPIFHGDISARSPSKINDPQDHVAHNLRNLPTQKYQGQGLGTEPSQATMPQTMRGPIDYPGQDIGA